MQPVFLNIPFAQYKYKIIIDCKELLNKLCVLFTPLITYNIQDKYETILIHRTSLDMRYEIRFNNKKYITDSAIQFLSNILYKNIQFKNCIIPIHSCCVSINNRAYIFIGETHVGKSTLVAHLCNNGFNYITDDCTLYNVVNKCIYPYTN